MDTSDVQRLKELTSENARLKRLLAERDLEVDALKELLAKMVSTELRRAAVSFLKERGLSERRSCVLAGLSRSGLRYQAHPQDDNDLRERLPEIGRRHKRYGYRRALALLRRDQLKVNHKRVHRLWKQIGLQCPVRRKRKRSQRPGSVPQEATHPNHVWTYDFVFDTTSDSRTLKFLTLIDEFTQECLAIKVERRLPAKAVIEVLEQVFTKRGMPEYLRSDNGLEFIAKAIRSWLKQRQVQTHCIQPGSPWQNAYGESFHSKFRDECLNDDSSLWLRDLRYA
jgi:putative transposase